MKYVVGVIIFVLSVCVTSAVTFAATQEIVGALFVKGFINSHIQHVEILAILDEGNLEELREYTEGLVLRDVEIIETMVGSLENGNYTYFTSEPIAEGRQYLSSLTPKSETSRQ